VSLTALLLIVLIVTPMAAAFVGYYQLLGRYVLNYHLRCDRVQFLLLGFIPFGHVKFLNIADIRKSEWFAALNPAVLALYNRFFGQWVLIRRKTGFRTDVLITPDDTDRFIEEVKAGIARVNPDNES
jgi:hypothetical protein